MCTEKLTRKEHLEWCKKRALEYLPNDPNQAFSSMVSDMLSHEATKDHEGLKLGAMMMIGSGGISDMDYFIKGFN